MSSHTRTHSFNLGPITKLLEGAAMGHIRERLGEAARDAMVRRIRPMGLTADLEPIDPNSAGWRDDKVQRGYTGEPLVMTGAMTEVDAWDVTVEGETVVLTLSADHHAKWDNIHRIAEETDRNWDRVYDLGPEEAEVVVGALEREVRKAIGI